MIKALKKTGILFIITGLLYLVVEVAFRALLGEGISIIDGSYLSLVGYTSLWMFFIGGVCGTTLGLLNEWTWIRNWPMVIQTIVGAVIVIFIEFGAGYLFNIVLGLNIWSYEGYFMNIAGQVCFLSFIYWLAITPFTFWADDFIRFSLFDETKPIGLFTFYKKNVTDIMDIVKEKNNG